MEKMDAAIKAEWQRRLRSGDWEQGKANLSKNGKYCCLGVLCEMAVEAGVVEKYNGLAGVTYYEGISSVLPTKVREWAKLETAIGSYDGTSLSEDNDERHKTFAEIADIIEANF